MAISTLRLCAAAAAVLTSMRWERAVAQVPSDSISREFTVFNDIEPVPTINDAVSREFCVYVGNQPLREQTDAAFREFTVFVDGGGGPQNDAISREFTVYAGNQPLREQTDCVAREFTLLAPEGQIYFTDTVSRELTVFQGNQPLREQVDCISREYTFASLVIDRGDLNCDGAINTLDIPHFIQALIDVGDYYSINPNCDAFFADINNDELINGADVTSFAGQLTSP